MNFTENPNLKKKTIEGRGRGCRGFWGRGLEARVNFFYLESKSKIFFFFGGGGGGRGMGVAVIVIF